MKKDIVLQADHLRKWFPVKGFVGQTIGNVKAVDDVSFRLYRGETYGLVGETGCGKSTLGRTIIRLLDPTDGTITVDGEDITKLSHRQLRPIRSKMQMVFQDPYTSLDGRMHVGDILMETLAIQNEVPREERSRLLLLANGQEILWIAGRRRTSHYPVNDRTKRILYFQIKEKRHTND